MPVSKQDSIPVFTNIVDCPPSRKSLERQSSKFAIAPSPRVLCATPVLSVVQLFSGERDPLDAGPHSPRKTREQRIHALYCRRRSIIRTIYRTIDHTYDATSSARVSDRTSL